MATREEAIIELYKRGKLNPQRKAAVDELIKRGRLVIDTPKEPESQGDELGVLDYIMGTGELLGTLATGTLAEPLSGFAGAVAAATDTPVEGGPEAVIKKAQEQFTYQPRTRGGRAVAQKLGKAIKPIAEPITKGVQAVSDIAYEAGGPVAGTAARTAMAAIPEILGLRGSKLAKKAALGKIVEGKDISGLYDEVGNLIPEIRKSIDDAGIDLDELKDIIPENIVEQEIAGTAAQIGEAATARIMPEKKALGIVEEVKPSQEILDAAEELGVSEQLLASHTSQNPTFVAIEQGLKSIPGSQLAAREKALASDLSRKADELIVEFGGEIDKSLLSDQFRTRSRDIVKGLEESAEKAYKSVSNKIDPKLHVEAGNIVNHIFDRAEELGGMKYLDAEEKQLLKALEPKSKPTYARLDKYRKQIGAGLNKKSGPFKDADEGALKQLYKALAEDQRAIAKKEGFGDLYETANSLIVSRKTLEKQLVKSLGKEVSGAITDKARPAMLAMQKGSTKQFDELMESIPEELGREMKQSVVATALNDAFVQGSRAERSLNIAGFDDFMKGLKRNKSAYGRLQKELGAEQMRRLDTFHKVVGGVREAQKSAITTGRISAVPGMFDEADNIFKRIYGVGRKLATAEGVTTAAGMPGMGTAGVVGAALSAKRGARSAAADAFLANPKFRKVLRQKASGVLESKNKLKEAERAIEKLKEYQAWKDTLDRKDYKDLATIGVIGYLTGEATRQQEQPK